MSLLLKDRIDEIVSSYKSLSALAQEIGVSEGTLRNWRKGGGEPRASELVRLARAGKVSVAWLLGLTDDRSGGESVSEAPEGYGPVEQALWDRLRTANVVLERLRDEFGPISTVWSTTIQELVVTLGLPEEGARRIVQSIAADRENQG